MKVYPFKIPKPENVNLVYQEDVEIVFYDKLHQHDEIQISYIKKGEGTLLVADNFTNYSDGDIFVIGSNIPHAFKSDKKQKENSVMLSLFFTKDAFGEIFFYQNDFSELHKLFTKINYGLQAHQNKARIKTKFNALKSASKLERFIILLEILKILSKSKTSSLSNFSYQKNYSDIDGKRLRNVFDYTLENVGEQIALEDIASVANMTKNAFCKYFKKRTNKTYINFLNELRIENTCKLLLENNDLTIPQIAYSCGFQNISNFNRTFKKLKQKTPLQFKFQHQS
ncbi:MAG: AraC family transcriptional regulator [Flavobacteriaceae bacterium]|nr:AraC family transcriptional regulator [Flavobacteriaceae bacterium]